MILTIIVAQINLKKICLPNTQKVVYNILMKFCKTFYQTILVRSNNKSSVVLLLSVETQEECSKWCYLKSRWKKYSSYLNEK